MSEPRVIRSPYQKIQSGGDAVDEASGAVFADFGPRIIPADAPEPMEEVAPKASSAQGSAADSSVSLKKTPEIPENPVPAATGSTGTSDPKTPGSTEE